MASQRLAQNEGAMPPPPGVEPNFINPPSLATRTIAVHSAFLAISTVSLGIRLYTKTYIARGSLGPDDFLAVFAWCLCVTFSALCIENMDWGMGRHLWDVPMTWMAECMRLFMTSTFIYLIGSGIIKAILLVLYRRLFAPKRTMRWCIDGGLVAVVATTLALFFATLFQCSPIQAWWDPSITDSYCFGKTIVSWVSGVLSVVLDLYTLLLPAPMLWGLNLPLKRKIRLMAVLGLGSLACIASTIRLAMTPKLNSSPDATWNLSKMTMWTAIEINVGLTCSSLMLVPAFLDHHVPESVKSVMSCLWDRFTSAATSTPSRSRHHTQRSSVGMMDKSRESALAGEMAGISWPSHRLREPDTASESSLKLNPWARQHHVEIRSSLSDVTPYGRETPNVTVPPAAATVVGHSYEAFFVDIESRRSDNFSDAGKNCPFTFSRSSPPKSDPPDMSIHVDREVCINRDEPTH